MSIVERYVVQCDHEYKTEGYCSQEFDEGDGDGPGAVEGGAKKAGWTVVGELHYCPIHSEEHKP